MMHIRLRLRPRRGSQWYRDKSERGPATYCGAPCTEYDVPWRDRTRAEAYRIAGREPCAECARVISSQPQREQIR